MTQIPDRNKESSLSSKAFKAIISTLTGSGLMTVFKLANLVIISRLLTPDEIGTMSAVMVVIGLSAVISEMGVGPAIVQKTSLSTLEKHTAYTLALVLGLICTTVVYSGRFLLSDLFRVPEIAPLLQLLSLTFLLRSSAVLADSLLQRALNFNTLVKIEITSYVAGYFFVSIPMALAGYGAWALAWGFMCETIIRSFALMFLVRHDIGICSKFSHVKPLLHFASGFTIAKIANYVALQSDYAIVGRMLGASMLGAYSRAYQLVVFPAAIFGQVVTRVLFPALSKIQSNKKQLGLQYRRSVSITALLTLPLSALLIMLAPEIIMALLGDQWISVIVPFQILSGSLLFRTSYKVSDVLTQAVGAVYRRAYLQIIYAFLVIIGSIVGQIWGLPGVASGVSSAIFINFLLMMELCRRVIDISLVELAKAHLPAILVSLLITVFAAVPLYILRNQGINEVSVILVVSCLSIAFLLFLIMTFPSLLGKDAKWIVNLLVDNIPMNSFLFRFAFLLKSRIDNG